MDDVIPGGPGTIVLGGKTYLVAQPTDADVASIGAYLKQHAKSPVAALQDDPDFQLLPEDEQRRQLQDAARKKFTEGVQFDPYSALDAITSLAGVRFMAWVLIRKGHPGVSLEEIAAHITDANRVEVSVQLDVASGMARLGNSAGRSG